MSSTPSGSQISQADSQICSLLCSALSACCQKCSAGLYGCLGCRCQVAFTKTLSAAKAHCEQCAQQPEEGTKLTEKALGFILHRAGEDGFELIEATDAEVCTLNVLGL